MLLFLMYTQKLSFKIDLIFIIVFKTAVNTLMIETIEIYHSSIEMSIEFSGALFTSLLAIRICRLHTVAICKSTAFSVLNFYLKVLWRNNYQSFKRKYSFL